MLFSTTKSYRGENTVFEFGKNIPKVMTQPLPTPQQKPYVAVSTPRSFEQLKKDVMEVLERD